ncbi:phosphoglycerate mutase family protein [Dysgonomonas sp. ZJ279]|uniref:phosphoglycerate mutase family protein n=1 Tax=Dysgonomonas sp. ZJ279 TaxID=2709796 RepID=UPI0013EA5E6C|nr:phosphoglycerate mutase family protein [Dysgonomonas sp. ZJ279]
MRNYLETAEKNQAKAEKIVESLDIVNIWESVGATINRVGSTRMGLLMKHRDIDFHIYTDSLDIADSFKAISKLALNPYIKKVEYTNLIDTDEKCIEWHAWYQDTDSETWQIDMIHILRGSQYDGYFENVADRIIAVLTPQTKETILKLKYLTPDTTKIMGIEYYQAVIGYGITDYDNFIKWKQEQPDNRIIDWIP